MYNKFKSEKKLNFCPMSTFLKSRHKIENLEAIYKEHNIKTLYKNVLICFTKQFRYKKKENQFLR